ncbi:sensor domain-containing diguanylate cyclase [Conexibacter stalactiti]|uniref:Sensor domain-containing diguanylate cyclase n=1 Tax=Conexibacter stalactiti TaxID=1940611 RepID=A0ABU4HHB1_9ACTN|nr:sensor domain-containing diguanylate cyclase [Conexibacter stalactiti]MDW5592708.1 sensor domain-containing diguanylate cyclase [Conexibacter stalactiti]MEC5033349.1 sensor domain-containing diguanylate cyclase [Conexibacter stalactiti]
MSTMEIGQSVGASDEQRRLAAVSAAVAAAEEASSGLQRLVTLVAHLLGYPEVRLNLVRDTIQVTVAAAGLEAGEITPRELSFCAQAILAPDRVLVAGDTATDPRFRDNPLVAQGLRAYVGAPLVSSDGCALGALCVTDSVPHEPSAEAVETLRLLADAVTAELEHSRALMAIAEVTAALACANDLDEVHTLICGGARTAGGADGGMLVVRDGRRLEVAATSEPLPEQLTLPVGPGSLTGRVCAGGRAEFHGDGDGAAVPAMTRALMERMGASAVAAFPVGAAGPDGAAGVLVVWWRRPLTALPATVRRTLATLADQAAVALERATLLDRLEQLSRTDPLTGLSNRRMLDEVLAREIARAARTSEPLTLAMLDLDHFKLYNDRLGHQAGDRLLRHAADAWENAVRRSDLVARYGGEEFTLVLPQCDAGSARALIERVRAATPDGETCSIGCATWDGIETPAALLDRADRALYAAKRAGRDRVVFDGDA